jgi:hypothetical protein
VSARLSPADRTALVRLARAVIRHRLGAGPEPAIPETGALGERRGAFVTLHRGGELRGCIGRFDSDGSLARTVAEVAVSAAFEDPRFPPLGPGELDDLDVHVSALGPRRPIADPLSLRIGEHGVVIRQGWHRGVLLPVVAVEQGWDVPTFLKHACLKAGLPATAWRDPATTVEVFDAEEFGESPEPA